MVATLSRASGNSYSIGNDRRFDVWGQLRTGSGGPSQKYCANLGHLEDYVSGLTYMRARYYEPKTGRFISEDPSRDGWNWYGYCAGDPVNCVDSSGLDAMLETTFWFFIGLSLTFGALATWSNEDPVRQTAAIALASFAIAAYVVGLSSSGVEAEFYGSTLFANVHDFLCGGLMMAVTVGLGMSKRYNSTINTFGLTLVFGLAYAFAVIAALFCIDNDPGGPQ